MPIGVLLPCQIRPNATVWRRISFGIFSSQGWPNRSRDMFIERAIESILIFICLAFKERVPHYLAATYPNLKDYESWIFIGWWVLLIAIYLGLVALLKTVLRSFPAWSGRYPQGVLQGAWLQHIGNERPWGVAYIKYDWRADQWIYAGVGFDDAMSLAAEWQTYGQ